MAIGREWGRRGVLGAGLTVALAGCNGAIVKIGGAVSKQFYDDDPGVKPEQVQAIPYSSLVARVGTGPTSILVLGAVQGEERHWFSADKAVIVTKNSRVVRTANFPSDLAHTSFFDQDPISGRIPVSSQTVLRRQIDVVPGDFFGINITSHFVIGAQPEPLTLYGNAYNAIKIVENCKADQVAWEFTNTYWQDVNSGLICKSVQHYVPSAPPLEIAVGRP